MFAAIQESLIDIRRVQDEHTRKLEDHDRQFALIYMEMGGMQEKMAVMNRKPDKKADMTDVVALPKRIEALES